MQLTRAADYALRVMIHLAGEPVGIRACREELARAAGVPPQFMAKILQSLTRANLIHSHRGAQGGFELAKPGAQISVRQIVEAIEGPICLNVCLAEEDRCGRRWWCGGHEVWKEAQAAMVEVLERATLARLAEESRTRRQGIVALPAQPGGPAWN